MGSPAPRLWAKPTAEGRFLLQLLKEAAAPAPAAQWVGEGEGNSSPLQHGSTALSASWVPVKQHLPQGKNKQADMLLKSCWLRFYRGMHWRFNLSTSAFLNTCKRSPEEPTLHTLELRKFHIWDLHHTGLLYRPRSPAAKQTLAAFKSLLQCCLTRGGVQARNGKSLCCSQHYPRGFESNIHSTMRNTVGLARFLPEGFAKYTFSAVKIKARFSIKWLKVN